jgi:hypothetical protein
MDLENNKKSLFESILNAYGEDKILTIEEIVKRARLHRSDTENTIKNQMYYMMRSGILKLLPTYELERND